MPFVFPAALMNRAAVFVDAGYFWVQAAYVAHNRRASRESVSINYLELSQVLLETSWQQFPGVELLRVYWYDGPGSYGKTGSHQAIEALDDFKLRLGTRNGFGDQKAVDGLIIADLISLTQSKAISHALIVSGDADLTPGVIASQGLGLRVHLLTLGPNAATSPFLSAEVDRKVRLEDDAIRKFVTPLKSFVDEPRRPVDQQRISGSSDLLLVSARAAIETLDAAAKKAIPLQGNLPPEVDALLLKKARETLKRSLEPKEKISLRELFRALLREHA